MEKCTMYRIVVIDDENDAIDVVSNLIKFLTSFSVKIVGKANDLEEGVEVIRKTKPDIVLLDIEMPGKNGLGIYDFFQEPDFKVIFVTAFNKYALEALKKSASDYLLKPFSIVELKEALQKTIKQIEKENHQEVITDKISDLDTSQSEGKKIVLDVEEGFIIVNTNNIEYCVANQSYSTIVTTAKKEILVSKSLKQVEELISDDYFYRTHKSYLVNILHIKKFVRAIESYVLLKSGTRIPVSSRKTMKISSDIKQLLCRD
jgi:two-component system, LytTR family, response regulator